MSQFFVDSNSSGTVGVETLTGNTGGAVSSTAHNINIVGSGAVTVTGNPGTSTLTISVSGAGFTWTNISASQTLAVSHGYFCSSGGTLSLALPAVSSVGDVIKIALIGSTGFTITQSASQQIRMGSKTTTAGVGGSISSTAQGDYLSLVCQTANLVWFAEPPQGNLTIV